MESLEGSHGGFAPTPAPGLGCSEASAEAPACACLALHEPLNPRCDGGVICNVQPAMLQTPTPPARSLCHRSDRGQPPLVPPDCIPSPWPALSHPQETPCPPDAEASTQTPEHPYFALQSRLAQTSNPQPPSSPTSWVFAAALLPRIFSSPDKKNQRFAVQQFPWQPHFPILSLNASLTSPGPSCWPPPKQDGGSLSTGVEREVVGPDPPTPGGLVSGGPSARACHVPGLLGKRMAWLVGNRVGIEPY